VIDETQSRVDEEAQNDSKDGSVVQIPHDVTVTIPSIQPAHKNNMAHCIGVGAPVRPLSYLSMVSLTHEDSCSSSREAKEEPTPLEPREKSRLVQ